jgi:hypothetical protein
VNNHAIPNAIAKRKNPVAVKMAVRIAITAIPSKNDL